MFGHHTYLGYTLIFCLPLIALLWLRGEFARELRRDLRGILISTAIVSTYGCAVWPLAMSWKCWQYSERRILNLKLFDYVFVEDMLWWVLVSFLVSSFVALATRREDLVTRELAGLTGSLRAACAGFRIVRVERNTTIHIAAAIATLLAAWLFHIEREEWLFVILAIAGVLSAEFLNSALERLAPSREERLSADVCLLKDTAAAGVLIMAVAAVVIGVWIFLPRVLTLFP